MNAARSRGGTQAADSCTVAEIAAAHTVPQTMGKEKMAVNTSARPAVGTIDQIARRLRSERVGLTPPAAESP